MKRNPEELLENKLVQVGVGVGVGVGVVVVELVIVVVVESQGVFSHTAFFPNLS